ncbi:MULTISPECIES: hypothetical protein [unclassified Streptomyces]|uniref:hypothetical protein n=1 Tax=unclassified Streptomyces TaxID=2593676 RepID=UPI002E28BF45|nr:hypothetical protein [Streptomyces sp. NBC_00272]
MNKLLFGLAITMVEGDGHCPGAVTVAEPSGEPACSRGGAPGSASSGGADRVGSTDGIGLLDPRFTNHPGIVEKAMAINDGTHP